DDIDSLKATAEKLGEFIADFYRKDAPEKQRNGSGANAFNRYNEILLKIIEDSEPYSKLWEELEPGHLSVTEWVDYVLGTFFQENKSVDPLTPEGITEKELKS
ncbi:MAG: hypothetical protein ACREBU_26545, partial [Nitrososphaera sp.]